MKKKFIVAIAAFMCMATVNAQQLKTPAPSPTTSVKQDFGLSAVELSYSRPAVKGRKVFGDLVPFGKVWRTGANTATTLTFGDDVNIGGTTVKAGKYGLLTIPDAKEWTIIITKQLDVTSPAAYKEDQDVVRVKAQAMAMPITVESFMITFDNIKANSMDVMMLWDKTAVSFPVGTDIDTKVMAQIDNMMNKDNRPYFNAAMYYLENGKDINKALTWFDKAVEQNPAAFWVHHQRANALAKLGKKQEAIAAANKSIELATAAKNDDYVALNKKLLATLK
jgi:Protein of unknown function (DUF2911)/Tetratricopeptide repeat